MVYNRVQTDPCPDLLPKTLLLLSCLGDFGCFKNLDHLRSCQKPSGSPWNGGKWMGSSGFGEVLLWKNVSDGCPRAKRLWFIAKARHVQSMYRNSPFRSTLNTSCITGLDMSKVCTEAVHSVALWTRVTFQDTKARPAWEKSGNTGNTYGRWVWDGARGEASGRKNWGYLCGCRQVNHLVRHGRIHLPKCPHTSARINSIHVPMTKHNLGGSRR